MTTSALTFPVTGRATDARELTGSLFIIVMIFLVGGDLFRVALGANALTAGLKFLMLFPMLFWVIANARFLLRGIFAVPELSGLLGIAIVSVLWSANPGVTAEKLFPLVITTSAGLTLGSKLSLRSLLIALGMLAAVTVFSSFAAIATLPSARGTPPWDDTWRGVFSHKNGLGSSCMFMLLYSSGAALVTTGRYRALFVTVAVGAAALLIQSESRTSQGITTLSMTALLLGLALRRWAFLWAMGYVLTILLAGIALVFLFATEAINPAFELVGREPTLSGRLPLWAETWPHAMERPWLGYGYQGFWEPDARKVIEISRDTQVGYIPHYSHNGLIETMLNTGIVGTTLFAILLVRLFVTVLSGFRVHAARPVLIVALVIVVAFLLLNVLESSILSRESLTWTVFVTVATKLGNVAAASRRTSRQSHSAVWRPLPGTPARPTGGES